MPTIRLPSPESNMSSLPVEKQVQALTDLVMRFRRELEYLLNGNLDEENGVIKAEAAYIEQIFAEYISTNVLEANTIIVNNLTAQKGYIAELTVDQLDTSDKVQNRLDNNTDDVYYIRINNQVVEWVEAQYNSSLPEVHTVNRNGNHLYWIDDTHTGVTEDTTAHPVMEYGYDEYVKRKDWFMTDPAGSGFQIPVSEWGVGTGVGDNAKFRMYKAAKGAYFDYFHSTTGAIRRIMLTDDGVDFSETVNGKVIYSDQTIVEGVVQVFVDTAMPTTAKDKDVLVEIDNPTIDDGLASAGTTLTWASPRQVNTTGNITLPNPASDKNIQGSAVDHTGVVMFCIRNSNVANGMVTVSYSTFSVSLFPQQSVTVRCGIVDAWEVV